MRPGRGLSRAFQSPRMEVQAGIRVRAEGQILGEGDRYSLVEGPTRRLLEVDALTVAVVRTAYRGVRLGRLSRAVNADIPTLSDIVARLTLAGLARLEGPGASPA